jgi:UDP-N-acetylmuramoylalanine--D-glutamate ligase
VIVSDAFRGKRYAVLGLARSGLATVEALVASGAGVVAWDSNEAAREVAVDAIQELSISLDSASLEFADPLTINLTNFDGIVVSPGVPINRHPIADAAHKANVPLIGDIELFAQARASLPPHKVVGITGTNGKSTTTALIHHILQTAGTPSLMGGNIGLPILGRDPLPEGGVYVLELSSYQIDLTYSLDCDIAVLLNITPDHLDRYDGFEGYVASKARLFEMQSDASVKIFCPDDVEAKKLHDFYFEPSNMGLVCALPAFCVNDPYDLWDPWNEDLQYSVQDEWPTLQGPHNAQNAAAAIVAGRMLGIPPSMIAEGLETYPGLPHRMEIVRETGGVLYVNDSKATNATSTAPALAAYPAIHWILGGQAKTDELDACAPHYDHVRAAYTIGEAGPMFAKLLAPHMPVAQCGVLDEAVKRAAQAAKPGETVLLSPACASFDQFKDFEARGDAFRAAVEALV